MSEPSDTSGPLYIAGELRDAHDGRRFEVLDPATEDVFGTAADAGDTDVTAAVAAARDAFDTTDWSRDHAFRRHCLQQLQDGMSKRIARLQEVAQGEGGTPTALLQASVNGPIDDLSWFIDLIDRFEWETDYAAHEMLGMRSNRRVVYEPYGVVAAITPWNAPLFFNMAKTAHILAAGNTMVLKTPPDTPLAAATMARVIAEETDIPPGVFNLISSLDAAAAGEVLTGDPRVDMFHFTGSPDVGQRIMQRAAVGVRKVCLELGGKSANLITEDADLDTALLVGVGLCMTNSGQGCNLPTRMIVHADVYEDVIERLGGIVGGLPWGDPRDPATVVGPLIRRGQVDRAAGLVDRARDAGAQVVVGGERGDVNGKGFFYRPTVITGVDQDSEIAQTEVFGPVLTVLRYEGGDDEAVRMANNSRYGLAGYVQTRDPERAWRLASRIRAGSVNIGVSYHQAPDMPIGGNRLSGVGREGGIDGFKECLQPKVIASPAPPAAGAG